MFGVPVNATVRKGITLQKSKQTLEVVGADVFVINTKTLLCNVVYHSRFPIVEKVNSL